MSEKNQKVFTLRIDNSLFERVKKDAEKNKRTITKHIEYILEKSLVKKTFYVFKMYHISLS